MLPSNIFVKVLHPEKISVASTTYHWRQREQKGISHTSTQLHMDPPFFVWAEPLLTDDDNLPL
jgi:hypothetical protein